jgi:hypothetical protein
MNIVAAALFALTFAPAEGASSVSTPIVGPVVAAVIAESDLNQAKALFFDRKYAESRAQWTEIAAAKGPNAEAATYWVARCSESLGESERAFREYGAFLDLPPADARLAEEAEISRIGLATKLTRLGKPGFLTAVIRSLGDDRAAVRYFGALQVGSLPNLADARKATNVLKEIVTSSKDPDLVERAKLQLLRIEPKSLADPPGPGPARATPTPSGSVRRTGKDPDPEGVARVLRIRITKNGKQTVAVTVPFSLAEFVYNSLPESTKHGLEIKGIDADGFWKRLRTLNVKELVSIVGEDGETIEIWIE